MFDPSKEDKQRFLTSYLRAVGDAHQCASESVALQIRLVFAFKRPKAHYRTGRYSQELKKTAPTAFRMLKTPDVDNLAKLVMDSLNGTLYCDDKQVVSLQTIKRYAAPHEDGWTAIHVEEFGMTHENEILEWSAPADETNDENLSD